MVGVIYVNVDLVFGFYVFCSFGFLCVCGFFFCLVRCFSRIVWTPAVLNVLYACVLCFCIWPCSAQLSMLHMERCSRNTLIIVIIIIIVIIKCVFLIYDLILSNSIKQIMVTQYQYVFVFSSF